MKNGYLNIWISLEFHNQCIPCEIFGVKMFLLSSKAFVKVAVNHCDLN